MDPVLRSFVALLGNYVRETTLARPGLGYWSVEILLPVSVARWRSELLDALHKEPFRFSRVRTRVKNKNREKTWLYVAWSSRSMGSIFQEAVQ